MLDLALWIHMWCLNPCRFRCSRPPMCFNLEDADFLIDTLDASLSEL